MSDEFFSARKYLTQQFNQKKACSMTLEEAKKQAMSKYNIAEEHLEILDNGRMVIFTDTQNRRKFFWPKGGSWVAPVPKN